MMPIPNLHKQLVFRNVNECNEQLMEIVSFSTRIEKSKSCKWTDNISKFKPKIKYLKNCLVCLVLFTFSVAGWKWKILLNMPLHVNSITLIFWSQLSITLSHTATLRNYGHLISTERFYAQPSNSNTKTPIHKWQINLLTVLPSVFGSLQIS